MMDLWVRRLGARGVRSVWIYDVLLGTENMVGLARGGWGEGGEGGGRRNAGIAREN